MRRSPSISHFMRRASAGALRAACACLALLALITAFGCETKRRLDPLSSSSPKSRAELSATCEDGAVRACSRVLETSEELVHCMKSEQTCVDGAWTPCGEDGGALIVHRLGGRADEEVPQTDTLSYSTPSSSVGNCNADPCNPGCMGFDEHPPAPLKGATSTTGFVNMSEWGNAPVGFTGKQDCSSSCNGPYPKNCNGTPAHQNRFDGCLADHHCDTPSGMCVRNSGGWTWPTSVCNGVDLTVGPWCTRYSGATAIDSGFPICNRGNTALAAGSVIKVAIKNGNWLNTTPSTVSTSGAQFCTLTLSSSLEAGACARLTSATCDPGSGNAVAYINYDGSIAECGYPEPGTLSTATSPGRSNNWSDIKKGTNACIELTAANTLVHVEDYVAQCGYNETPVWDLLTFQSTVGCSPSTCDGTNGGSVVFEAQTAQKTAPTTFSSKVVVGNVPSVQAAVCSLSGPSPNCPASLYTPLTKPKAEADILRLTITLNPSPDKQVASSLSDWQVTYRCIPSD